MHLIMLCKWPIPALWSHIETKCKYTWSRHVAPAVEICQSYLSSLHWFRLTYNAFQSQSTITWGNKTLMLSSIEAGQILTMFPAYYVFNFLLTTLLILHLFWGYFIIKVAYKVGKPTTTKTSFIFSGNAGWRHSYGHKESVGKLEWLESDDGLELGWFVPSSCNRCNLGANLSSNKKE